jgi:uncharacterized membrane protein YkvA (DUF1232 family)
MSKTSWKDKAKHLKTEVHALYLACRDPRVPWYVKTLMALIIGYAISPIDLIPDFIPILGQIDDLLILPLAISIVIKMIPKNVMNECRYKSRNEPVNTKTKWIIALIIISIWILTIYLVIQFILQFI